MIKIRRMFFLNCLTPWENLRWYHLYSGIPQPLSPAVYLGNCHRFFTGQGCFQLIWDNITRPLNSIQHIRTKRVNIVNFSLAQRLANIFCKRANIIFFGSAGCIHSLSHVLVLFFQML